jgi:flavin reductase (DIM6/NTAB) family NADH-FMN oxidoreductase RutF
MSSRSGYNATMHAPERAPADDFASLDQPMVVVTTSASGARAGCLVGFHTRCSIVPARYLACISVENHTLEIARRGAALAVHFLTPADLALARLFGETTGDEIDKFERCRWDIGPLGLPILCHGGSWVACPIVHSWEAGDHVATVIDVIYAGGSPPTSQLQLSAVRDLEPGHPA